MEEIFISEVPIWMRLTGRKTPVLPEGGKLYPEVSTPDPTVDEALGMLDEGKSLEYVATRVKINKSTVIKIKRLYLDTFRRIPA